METGLLFQYLTTTISFAPFQYEHRMKMPAALESTLLDVQLSLYAHPTFAGFGGIAAGSGLPALHVYFNEHEITDHVRRALIDALESATDQQFRAQYEASIEATLLLHERLGAGFPGGSQRLADERVLAPTLPSKDPDELLDKLFDPTMGWSGSFHILNFLYHSVQIQPISLAEILRQAGILSDGSLGIGTLRPLVLTFSAGPSRFHTNSWSPSNPVPRGGLTVTVGLKHRNADHEALETRVKTLEGRFQTLSDRVDSVDSVVADHTQTLSEHKESLVNHEEVITDTLDQILEYLEPSTGSVGSIEKRIAELNVTQRNMATSVTSIEQSVNSHGASIANIEQSVNDLKDA